MLTAQFPTGQSNTVAPGGNSQAQLKMSDSSTFVFDSNISIYVVFVNSYGQAYATTSCAEPSGTDLTDPSATRTLQFSVPTNLYPDTYALQFNVSINGVSQSATLAGLTVATGYIEPTSATPVPTSAYDTAQVAQEASEEVGGGGASTAQFATSVLTRSGVAKNRVSRLIQFEGTSITLDNGLVLRGFLQQNDRAISRSTEDASNDSQRPEVIFFGGEAFGKVKEGNLMTLTDEDTFVQIGYKVDGPIHPAFYRNKCVYLAVPVTKY